MPGRIDGGDALGRICVVFVILIAVFEGVAAFVGVVALLYLGWWSILMGSPFGVAFAALVAVLLALCGAFALTAAYTILKKRYGS